MKLKNFMLESHFVTEKFMINDAKEEFIKYLYEQYLLSAGLIIH
jgi:hypothetical protein